MATIAEIFNVIKCNLSDVYGTGKEGCDAFLRDVKSIWLTPVGFKYDKTKELDSEYANQLIAEGKLIVLNKIVGFTDNSEEAVYHTYDDGTKELIRKGKYEFGFNFKKGLYYQKALNTINSFNAYDVTFVDVNNNILVTETDDANIKGYSTNYIQVGKIQMNTGSQNSQNSLMMQLQDPDELDQYNALIKHESIAPFRPKNLEGINQVKLTLGTELSDGDTSIVVKAVIHRGGGIFTGADDLGNFLVKVNGSTITPSAVSETPNGTYTFTVSALSTNDIVEVSLYDASESRIGVTLDNSIYKSNTLTSKVLL